jgi:hypothetical protein
MKNMKRSAILTGLVAMMAASLFSRASAQTVQTPADVFDGRPYLWVEAESFESLTGNPDTGWKVVTKGGPDLSVGSALPILPETSNVSGSAIWAQANDFSSHAHTAQYELTFITPGTYQLYLRQSLYDSNANDNFLNEDSIFLPPAFNMNSSTDWVGFEGLEFDESDPAVEIPNPGFALDPDGYKPSTGNHDRDGLLELANWGIKSDGVVQFHTPSGTASANGNFSWYNRPTYQGITETGGFDGFFGFKTEFTVTPDMVGEPVNFEVGTREVNVVIDGFMFIQVDNPFPDMDLLDLYSQEEVDAAILPQPLAGDYNNNGTVDAADYVVWRNGDSPDDTQAGYDLWKANFGNSSGGPPPNAAGVPEPAALMLCMIGMVPFIGTRPRRNR